MNIGRNDRRDHVHAPCSGNGSEVGLGDPEAFNKAMRCGVPGSRHPELTRCSNAE
jgi:hypothetical protein